MKCATIRLQPAGRSLEFVRAVLEAGSGVKGGLAGQATGKPQSTLGSATPHQSPLNQILTLTTSH